MSLRVRLVLVVLVLTGVGLVISGVLTSSAMRSYLSKRVDDRLSGIEAFALRRLTEPSAGTSETANQFGNGSFSGAAVLPRGANGDVLATRYDPSGRIVREFVPPFSNASDILQSVPESVLNLPDQGKRSGPTKRSRAFAIASSPNRSRTRATSR